MSILIKGVSMPKHDDEYVIFTVYGDGGVVYVPLNRPHVRYKNRAVPVPPHGRLIDADAAIDDIRGEILEHQMNGMKGTPFYIEDLRSMWQRLEDEELVPTIIPASEEGE